MLVFVLMNIGSWIGLGYSIGTHNLVGKIVFPVISIIVSIVSAAISMIEPINKAKYIWDDED
jgi:hypothetical protein